MVSSLVLRYGHAFEELAWAIIFILLPFSCVYYPLDSLPPIMQKISIVFPPAHIFESMRDILINGVIRYDLIKNIIVLNTIYLFVSIFFFLKIIAISRTKGLLINQGE